MNGFSLITITITTLILCLSHARADDSDESNNKCKIPAAAPRNIAKVINQCQDEIKVALLSEAAQFLKDGTKVDEHIKSRRKRQAFTNEERKIAGCLLQCVYRKMKAVNSSGFPTIEGLVTLYTEGVTDRDYIIATFQAVHTCLTTAQTKHITTPQSLTEGGKTCDIAFDVFDCVSDRIGEYCGQTP